MRCYASTGISFEPVSVCVCHMLVLYQNGCTDQAGLWHTGLPRNLGILPSRTLSQTRLGKYGQWPQHTHHLVSATNKR